MDQQFNDGWINEKEAASLLSFHRQTMSNMRAKGIGPSYSKLGRACRYRLSDVIKWAESKKIEVKD